MIRARMKRVLFFAIMILSILWSINSYAFERRVGSLEFSYTSPPDPVGIVLLYHGDIKKPSISYQVPESPGGHFTTPWGMLLDSNKAVIGDTDVMLTNPDAATTLTLDITLRDKFGDVGSNCTRTLRLKPKETKIKSLRVLFPGCPAVSY